MRAAAKDFERAIPLYDRAIALDPARAEPYYKRANALKDVGRLEEAVASYDLAVERKPDYAYAFCNRGVVQQRLGLLPQALSSLDRAIALEPTDAVAHYNRAMVLQECSRWGEAVASYDQAVALNPDFAEAQYNRALTLLFLVTSRAVGPPSSGVEQRAAACHWRGERLFGCPCGSGTRPSPASACYFITRRGWGDTLQFCRYATLAAARGATVLLEVQPSLASLLAHLEGVSEIIPSGGTLPAFDSHCPLMSLPLAFNTTLETVRPRGVICATTRPKSRGGASDSASGPGRGSG